MKARGAGAYVTVYLALTLGVMMSLIFTLLEGVRMQTIRLEAEGVMDMALFSVFGEYNRQLFEQYDLLYIDTAYGQTEVSADKTKEHLQKYMNLNFDKEGLLGLFRDITALNCDSVSLDSFVRASDASGAVVKEQIVEYMKDKSGISLAENLISNVTGIKSRGYDQTNMEEEWSQVKEEISSLLQETKQEAEVSEGEDEERTIDNPADYVAQVKETGILGLALPSGSSVSGVEIHPSAYLSHRQLMTGTGTEQNKSGTAVQAADRVLLQSYLQEKCSSFANPLDKGVLKYQLEYLIKGSARDETNLKQVAEDILHIREAANLAYLFSDSTLTGQADTLATVITAVLFKPELQQAVKLSILFAWCYAESVKDLRILFEGNKVPLVKDSSTWNTPLTQLLTFTSHLSEYNKASSGMEYTDYLQVLLYSTGEKQLLYRFMDICEMDIRLTDGNTCFRMDGCIDRITATANVSSGYGPSYTITRSFSY